MHGLLPRIAVGVFGLLTVAVVLLAIFDDQGALEVRKRHTELGRLHQEVAAVQQQNESLKSEIYALKHDPAAIERIAREKHKLVKPGEILLLPPESQTTN